MNEKVFNSFKNSDLSNATVTNTTEEASECVSFAFHLKIENEK